MGYSGIRSKGDPEASVSTGRDRVHADNDRGEQYPIIIAAIDDTTLYHPLGCDVIGLTTDGRGQ
jgi:hypothetical protein